MINSTQIKAIARIIGNTIHCILLTIIIFICTNFSIIETIAVTVILGIYLYFSLWTLPTFEKRKAEKPIVVTIITIGLSILFINYHTGILKIWGIGLLIYVSGFALMGAFGILAIVHIIKSKVTTKTKIAFTVFYCFFFFNILYNPFNIDKRPQDQYMTKMIAGIEGTFSLTRIIFDTSNHFVIRDVGMPGEKIYKGEYRIINDTNIVLITNKLPDEFKDTLTVNHQRNKLYYSINSNFNPMYFRIFDSPVEKRLDPQRRMTMYQLREND